MRLKVAPEDVGDLDFSDWIARLRDEPGTGGDADAAPYDAAQSGDDVAARPADVTDDGPVGVAEDGSGDVAVIYRSGHAAATPSESAPARPGERAALGSRRARGRDAARAVIGNQIRTPAVWCELAPCISRYSDPVALGEADIRVRAISAGWRADRFGRLTCPQCQQSSPLFWSAQPVALWDKETAMMMVALMAEGRRESRACNDAGAAETAFTQPVQAPITPPGRPEIRGRHRKQPRRPTDIPDAEDIAVMAIADG